MHKIRARKGPSPCRASSCSWTGRPSAWAACSCTWARARIGAASSTRRSRVSSSTTSPRARPEPSRPQGAAAGRRVRGRGHRSAEASDVGAPGRHRAPSDSGRHLRETAGPACGRAAVRADCETARCRWSSLVPGRRLVAIGPEQAIPPGRLKPKLLLVSRRTIEWWTRCMSGVTTSQRKTRRHFSGYAHCHG